MTSNLDDSGLASRKASRILSSVKKYKIVSSFQLILLLSPSTGYIPFQLHFKSSLLCSLQDSLLSPHLLQAIIPGMYSSTSKVLAIMLPQFIVLALAGLATAAQPGLLFARSSFSGVATFNNYASQSTTVCGSKSGTVNH